MLNPYLDSDGLLCIQGRLRSARLPGAVKNPIVLRAHPLLSRIIEHHHLKTLHAGLQLTITSLQNKFWILCARTTVCSVIHKCIQCSRQPKYRTNSRVTCPTPALIVPLGHLSIPALTMRDLLKSERRMAVSIKLERRMSHCLYALPRERFIWNS